jgi:DNA-binding FadR family transcriptional regulator
MKKVAGVVLNLEVSISRDEPLHRQLYVAVKRVILDARLRGGDRLPSTGVIADDFDVSRSYGAECLRPIVGKRLLEGRVGSGVRPSLPISLVTQDLLP